MHKSEKCGFVSLYAIGAVMAYIVFNQGGFFAGGIISVGLIISLLLFRTKIQLTKVDLMFFVFSLWYLFCSVRTGFDVRHIAKGLLPLLCLMFKMLIGSDSERGEDLCKKVIKISFYITLIAIAVGISSCIRSSRLLRLIFPFQYANASGIFFGVMFILSRYSGFEWAWKRQYVFFIALALTQSVGAIALTVFAEVIMSRNKKKTLIMLAVIAVGAVVLRGRVYQSIGTFIERFLQMYDGIVCMADNPVFGIGAQKWAEVKNLYQSGFYSAGEIHGSFVQIGVDSGVPGLILFIISAVVAFKNTVFSNKAYLAGILMIAGHCMIDFTLAFTAFGFLLILLFACGENKALTVLEFKPALKNITAVIMAVGFFVLSVGMYQIKKLDGKDLGKNYAGYVSYYEANVLSQKSLKTKENYAKALYATGNKEKCLEVLKSIDVLSADMVVLEKGCLGDWREVLEHLKEQPYNTVLYKTVCYNSNDETLQKETREMLDEAINSMSFLGKVLFNFKGEKIL